MYDGEAHTYDGLHSLRNYRVFFAVPFYRQRTGLRRVAPVPVTVSYQVEGAPGPSLLGTGDIDTMQAQTSIRLPDTPMTPPLACLLRAVSPHPSISTGRVATVPASQSTLRVPPATARVDALPTGWLLLPGPQKRGTGGTLNLIKCCIRPGPPATLNLIKCCMRPGPPASSSPVPKSEGPGAPST
jgi:hypothetical protein